MLLANSLYSFSHTKDLWFPFFSSHSFPSSFESSSMPIQQLNFLEEHYRYWAPAILCSLSLDNLSHTSVGKTKGLLLPSILFPTLNKDDFFKAEFDHFTSFLKPPQPSPSHCHPDDSSSWYQNKIFILWQSLGLSTEWSKSERRKTKYHILMHICGI